VSAVASPPGEGPVHEVVTTLEFPYMRSLGPVIGAFFEGLRDAQITGVRTTAGRVLVPPLEHDPDTGEAVQPGSVPVGPGGEVLSWTWVEHPLDTHPCRHPFAFALIRLDGASTALTHVVEAAGATEMRCGMRVVPRWREDRQGRITDIEAFVAEPSS